jgi:hypothetical protein
VCLISSYESNEATAPTGTVRQSLLQMKRRRRTGPEESEKTEEDCHYKVPDMFLPERHGDFRPDDISWFRSLSSDDLRVMRVV